ncbi:pentatricopeptide repeat-containing protein At1g01970 [Ziziphus jujuba]|uniref:Pentatricopeptide repeat-containing protein At1g01970 n=1 Tax=Ziziphus jujuba TaxID=326968 RepID=A0A6P4BTX6_ZIZJJ|nr:pentatricopeptide repeat-containing protein At1g01970 [Ziziphus jujuba]
MVLQLLSFMATSSSGSRSVSYTQPVNPIINETGKFHVRQFMGNSFLLKPMNYGSRKLHFQQASFTKKVEETAKSENEEGKPMFKWVEIGPHITEAQRQAISKLSPKLTKRCKALMRQLICFSPHKASLSDLLAAWVRTMKPRRADWLAVLKELKTMDHPFYLQVAELALLEETFEANIRDYTKIIHGYGKQNRLKDAEKMLSAMKSRGFVLDQVTLTAFIDIYSKAGKLNLAEETFEELKLLGQPLDKRSYGSMIMAYIRAGMPIKGENILKEMDAQEIYAGSEVYKAMLRSYSMAGDCEGAQRVFDAIQFAGISPDVRMCALLINAYGISGQSDKARLAFENMRRAGLEPSDKCVAVMLLAYEKENELQKALEFLMDLERDGILVGKEASETLVGWFRKLGVVKEVDTILREYPGKEANSKAPAS